IPQYSLVGSVLNSALLDNRIFLNTHVPASFFVCGLHGSGKSHTLLTMLESYLIPSRRLGVLQKPGSGLVLHFDGYNSKTAFRPCEAAFLASPNPPSSAGLPAAIDSALSVTVLVSPSNYHNLLTAYSHIPHVRVYPLKIRARDLTFSDMRNLIPDTESADLYMVEVTKLLHDMALSSANFDYIEFTTRLGKLNLQMAQPGVVKQRLDLLETFLDHESTDSDGQFNGRPGDLAIVDLSCPFVDAGAACVLFRICIELYLRKSPDVAKIIAVDEAHQYMTATPPGRSLTDQLLSIIRRQWHFGVRIIIATQEPVLQELMGLVSVIIIHRLYSSEWFETLRKRLSIRSSSSTDATDLFDRIISLKVGEAIVFAPSALL
ncbi:hypothetical protein BDZ91DRAFT_614658, partial [Kalaharituber pfeilii]